MQISASSWDTTTFAVSRLWEPRSDWIDVRTVFKSSKRARSLFSLLMRDRATETRQGNAWLIPQHHVDVLALGTRGYNPVPSFSRTVFHVTATETQQTVTVRTILELIICCYSEVSILLRNVSQYVPKRTRLP